MPVEWSYPAEVLALGGAGAGKISAQDAARQEATVRSLLLSLRDRPGQVLADEVGMGKTYVALGVVASVLLDTRNKASRGPVVVMAPSGLVSKWDREWDQFRALCVRDRALDWVRDGHVHTATQFFKLLDDHASGRERTHLIWMNTGCFARNLRDPWFKLALIRMARTRTRLEAEQKKSLVKWVPDLVRGLKGMRQLTPEVVRRLLRAKVGKWKRILVRAEILTEDADDPVPELLAEHADELDFSELVRCLRDEVPRRRGPVTRERLAAARNAISDACKDLHRAWLARVDWRGSLLVLDEAHHAKNDYTRLAKLFRSDETTQLLEREDGQQPALWGKFDRLLFLTATPFQLGHHELIRVLRSFAAARWRGRQAPTGTRAAFLDDLTELEERLNHYRRDARRLDRLWSRLTAETLDPYRLQDTTPEEAAAAWWASDHPLPEEHHDLQLIRDAVIACRQAKLSAEQDPERPGAALRTWVARHNRDPLLPREQTDGALVPRREQHHGGAVCVVEDGAPALPGGLPLTPESTLPFLLSARAQGELAALAERGKGRAFFAEGLCSSYEAFHHTREQRGDPRDANDDGAEQQPNNTKDAEDGVSFLDWYEERIGRLIPSRDANADLLRSHPKVKAVIERTVDLWLKGEKVLIFCFYRQTCRALRDHLTEAIRQRTCQLAATRLGLDPNDEDEAWNALERIANRLGDPESPFHDEVLRIVRQPFERPEFASLHTIRPQLEALLTAYVRSRFFVARYLPLDEPNVQAALAYRESRSQVIQAGVEALGKALETQRDASALTLLDRIEEFLRFAVDLHEQSQRAKRADEEGAQSLLDEYVASLASHRAGDEDTTGTYVAGNPVRMVNGSTQRDTRERVMLAFNSPLYPEILVASAVLGEGVDLHRFCRHVIHHDLCWNPSTLEQRTGRLDRIRCKAERSGRSILVFEPYLAGSADEKMFRVVRDRERWFQIVMGQTYAMDEASTDDLSGRVPLPQLVAEELLFDLRRFTPPR